MDKFDGYKQQLEKDLSDDSKPWTKYLKIAEEKTGVQRIYLFFGELLKNFIINRLMCKPGSNEILYFETIISCNSKFLLF